MMMSKKFRNKRTGEIRTVIPILSINDWEEVSDDASGELSKANLMAQEGYHPSMGYCSGCGGRFAHKHLTRHGNNRDYCYYCEEKQNKRR